MESEIEACDFVLVVCTPEYAKKSTSRAGGVGYEQQIISGSLASGIERRKFIPLVRAGDLKAGTEFSIPPHFQGILAIDMRGQSAMDSQLESLLRTIFKVPAVTAPALARPPAFVQEAATGHDLAEPSKPARLSLIEFDGWQLISAVAMNEKHPNTFSIPSAEHRPKVIPSDFVKLGFEVADDDPDDDKGVPRTEPYHDGRRSRFIGLLDPLRAAGESANTSHCGWLSVGQRVAERPGLSECRSQSAQLQWHCSSST